MYDMAIFHLAPNDLNRYSPNTIKPDIQSTGEVIRKAFYCQVFINMIH